MPCKLSYTHTQKPQLPLDLVPWQLAITLVVLRASLYAAPLQIDMPDGNALALSIGIASGCLGDGLIGSPGNMQYQCAPPCDLATSCVELILTLAEVENVENGYCGQSNVCKVVL